MFIFNSINPFLLPEIWTRMVTWPHAFVVKFLNVFTGESDSGSGASPPDEPIPGQSNDHPQRRDVAQRRTVTDQQHSPLPHPTELFPCHPGCRGELYALIPAAYLTCWQDVWFPARHLPMLLPSGRGICFQFEHQRCVFAEIPKCRICVAGRGCQWWGDGGCQTCDGLPGWQCQPCVRGQGTRWVFSEDKFLICNTSKERMS